MDSGNLIVDLTFDFSIAIMEFTGLLEEKRKYVLANQLLKYGTSIGANVNEAQSAESLKDFIHKLKIADKEGKETKYWLLLCKHAKNYPFDEKSLEQLISIQKVLNRILSSSIKKLKSQGGK
ncbi:MAG: four helix bundle protein [Flammeovirgaceae bacterium]|jgi:four helix bundle protein